MTPEQSAALLKEFPAEAIGKLPRVTCRACTKANKEMPGTTCAEHRKVKCDICSNWISERHIHLDYVGHAIATKRLLDVDPEWTWEPMAFDQNGVPVIAGGGLWIKMTVCGVTRPGWGDGANVKEMISDAIRNAAMRFGVALDLWSKEDLRASDENVEAGSPAQPTGKPVAEPASTPSVETPAPPTPGSPNRVQQLQSKLSAMISEGIEGVATERTKRKLPKLTEECTAEELNAWADLLNEFDPNLTRELAPKVEKAPAPVMSRAESKANEAGRMVETPVACPECGAGPLEAHASDCQSAPF